MLWNPGQHFLIWLTFFCTFSIVDPLYYWQQTEDDVTITIHIPQDITKDDIKVHFSPENIRVTLKDQPPLMDGKLHSSVDHESCTWIIKENKRCCIWFLDLLLLGIDFRVCIISDFWALWEWTHLMLDPELLLTRLYLLC